MIEAGISTVKHYKKLTEQQIYYETRRKTEGGRAESQREREVKDKIAITFL